MANSNAVTPPKPSHTPHDPTFPRLERPISNMQAKPVVILRISQTTRFPPLIMDLISARATKTTTPPAIDVTITRIVKAFSMLIAVSGLPVV
ncbi:MAG: hypothetical protein WA808_18860 [Xanthobacteraceae bacterium]